MRIVALLAILAAGCTHLAPADDVPLATITREELIARAATHSVVLLGESTHGTREFYDERAAMTRELVTRHGFAALAIEADAGEADVADRYVRHLPGPASLDDVAGAFATFPPWMWRNEPFLELLEWLRAHNSAIEPSRRVRVVGLDFHGFAPSAIRLRELLAASDPRRASQASSDLACLERLDLRGRGAACPGAFDSVRDIANALEADADVRFRAASLARVFQTAELTQRSGSASETWNLRERHMLATLLATLGHLETSGLARKAVVWGHNTHVGDARFTSFRANWSLGQLLRDRDEISSFAIGFLTATGRVTAASRLDAPARTHTLADPLRGSVEHLLVGLCPRGCTLPLGAAADPRLRGTRPERVIGVVYLPAREREGHYLRADLARQFDAAVFIPHTDALTPSP